MTETQRIAVQMRQAFEGVAWHGPSVTEILEGVDAVTARAKPIAEVHSIWEIVLHLLATQRVLLRRLDGDTNALNLPHADEWPAVPEGGEGAWQATLQELTDGDRRLRGRVEQFPPVQLDGPLIPGGSSAYNNFHGYVQHNLYHAAQIGLLKKAQTA
jgi:hypothetical protein